VSQASKVWGEVPLPEDLESEKDVRVSPSLLDDDEDFAADEVSGRPSGEEDGSTPEYYRALVNFTNSVVYGPELEDIFSPEYKEISEAVMDTLESEYNKIPGVQTVNVVLIEDGVDIFVELDVGSEYNSNEEQIRTVLYNVVKEGAIASYVTSVQGFQFRQLGKMADEYRCSDGTCILMDYVCDNRPDCTDLSDETNCKADQARCQSGECISRIFICDGERDCQDGSDELRCGTPSPCEPNEFKCKNGRCALKLWRCDGDNDCEDNSDETDCPNDRCSPEQFECSIDKNCIPASYQCDEEPDCADRSDEIGCPPTVVSPPEESVEAARGSTVTFTCQAVGIPTPIITWRLNWGHIPKSDFVMTSENGRGTLIIRDVKEVDQGAYTCEAINAKGLVFGIPDGVLTLISNPNPENCPDGHFRVDGRCISCFCAGVSKNCKRTGRYRNQISLRFTEEEDFKVNVTYPPRPGTPPLSSTQLLINPEMEEFQLVDLSRRFLTLDSYWTLPRRFLGNKIDSYGGSLRFKVRYTLARGLSEPVERSDVIIVGNGRRLVYRRGNGTPPNVVNQKEIIFTEDHWQHSNGLPVSREELMMTLADLASISIRTVYDNHMVSVALSHIVMDTTTVEFSTLGHAKDVEECCPAGYTGLSCEMCLSGFERVPGGRYLGTCAGCNCNGHATACDPISGYCLSCQHNTEGPQCDKCRPGYFGDPIRGRPDDCKPCPCPYTETSRFSDTCFLNVDQQPTCDACRPGYTGRRCEPSTCDNRGTISSSSRPCSCKNNVAGDLCDECKAGFFHLSEANPEGCLRCFCMGVSSQCASSSWSRDQVRGGVNGQLFTLLNSANTKTISDGILQRGSAVVYRPNSNDPSDVFFWVLPESFRGDKLTAYGGELSYTVTFEPYQRALVVDRQPDVVLQGNDIFLEHYSQTKPLPRVPQAMTVTFREQSSWRRADGQPCTREHLLMALADVSLLMIRATYVDSMAETISDIKMDIAVPHVTGSERALEVEECACPVGYTGASCQSQECDVGYARTTSGLYLSTCERCDCNGYASSCDPETGRCLQCLHNTDGERCEKCLSGFYGDPTRGGPEPCKRCPCYGTTSNAFSPVCHLGSDGQPVCDTCPPGLTGLRCECAPGYIGNPLRGQECVPDNDVNGCYYCDQAGRESCSGGVCLCKTNVEGPSCSTCKAGTFHLSQENKDGCLSCFCMGVTQQCFSSTYYRDVVSSVFTPRNFQGFALVNRQRTSRVSTGFTVEISTEGTQLSYSNFNYLGQGPHFWQLPDVYQGDKVGSYGGKLKYTITYVTGSRGTELEDADVQIIGNDITLVARQAWRRNQPGSRERRQFEIIFREEHWRRPDGMPATREHLMMVLADLDDILIRASYSTEMRSSSISDVSMEVAVPNYSGLAQAFEVEQCRCPPGYQGLSCQDCAPGYTRTGGGLYLGHCELCDCNGHSDSCHPETGTCTQNCLHNTQGDFCEQCAPGFFGDPTAGTPEDCQRCGCPHTDPDNFSPTCESLGNGDYLCTSCQPGYTGQHCEAHLEVKVYPERFVATPGSSVTLRCQVSGSPPHYFFWSRQDGRPISSSADRRRQAELYFSSVQPSDAGIYICTCQDQRGSNRSHAEIIVAGPTKPIEVTVEEPKFQTVRMGSTVNFICTARSKSPAYTLVWTRKGNRKLPNRATDFNGILTIQNVQPEDAGVYVCTGSNMFAMDESSATLYVPAEGAQPVATITPSVLNVQQGQRAELRCTVTGNPTPAVEWIGPGYRMSPRAVIRNGFLTIPAVDPADEGEYTCKALNTHGEHTARASLHVQPQVQVSPQSVDIREGEPLRLYCRATGSPTPKLTWLKDRTDIGTLFIPNIKLSDAGTYMCVGSNSVGSNRTPIRVTVLREQSFSVVTIQPSIADVQEGQTLELNCFPPGNPPPRVTWSRASGHFSANHQLQSPIIGVEPHSSAVRVGESASFRCQVYSGAPPVRLEWKLANNQPLPNVRVNSDGSVITIVNARPVNHGAYRCVASNLFGITQTIVSLIVKSPGAIVTPAGPLRVRVGEPINLECQASGEPRPSVSWHRLDNNRKTTLTSPVPMDSNAVMQILVARPEDSGTYVCVARNTEGTTETRVEVIIEGGSQMPSAPRALVPEPLMVVVEGQTATLRCDAYFPSPVITWSKLRSSLPRRQKLVNNSLVLQSVGRQDSGEYICSATNNMGTSEVTIMLEVEPPYVTSVPDDVAVRVGEVIRLQCLAHGTPPLTYTWTKLGGSLPSRAQASEGDLQIDLATSEDAGSYKCVASNRVGNSEVVAKVTVRPLAVRVSPQVEVKAQGSAVEFTCSAAGGVHTQLEWLKEGGALPPNHDIKDGVLIENLEQGNEGVYICRATSAYGQAQDTARLTIQLPKVMINVRTSMQTVMIGNAVEFECHAVGDPEPTVRWSKVGGPLPSHIMVKDGMLRISQVTEADAGHYRCTATNDVGSVQSQVLLNVQLPQISALPETKEVTVGSDAVMPCLASGYPVPNIKWTKSEGELPPKCIQEANVLTVPQVTHEDSGTYICTASNEHGKVAAFTKLEVHRVMPYFAQEPVSYLTLPTIKNAYKAFDIKINFRPDNVDGMILYNGQRRTTGADFISLGLVSGRLEFRFDVGSGMATIRDPNPIKLGEFHTVEVNRNLTEGYIIVDGGEPISGKSQGKFQGLDLNEELHVGGYPNYTSIVKTAGIKTGFVCIRQLVIQGEEVIFKELDRSSTGVTNCPTCKDYPCQNGGRCQDSEASLYRCTCPRGFTGSNCQHHSSLHCHSACGPDATCINRPNGLGYDCRCHLGKFGDKCMQELVTTPLFDGDESYIAYPPLTIVHDDLRVELEFKPLQRNGLMFFCGGKKTKVEDFVAVSMVEGHVEFRYELGTQAVLLSPQPVSLGQWHRVVAERNKRSGHLMVDQGPVQRRMSPGKAQGLNIHTPMYLGGVPSMDILPKPANVTQMFDGCIGEQVSINNKKVDLSYSFTESKSISKCVDNSPCDHRPCLHGGECMSNAEYEYQCLCKDGFEERCEVVRFVCQSDIQCQNGGTCVEGKCVCMSGHTGLSCEEQVFSFAEALRSSETSEANSPYQYAAHFQSDGYIALPKSIFPRVHDAPETIEMEINTSSSEGLILWQGVVPGEHSKGKDFISLGLQNGHLVFYQLGSGEARIRSTTAINDGKWHKITAAVGKDGFIQIDGGDEQHGQSKGKSLMVNTKGSIYLGAPDITAMTGRKFSSGISGCVRNLMLTNARPGLQPGQPIDLQAHAAHGINVQPCSS
uniref:Heparan sulfate proteoglycan 2 n=1 Tax=Poecilia latipinna TaxID=48699 RepID=A0A3B3VSB1_9TELE